RQQKAFDVVFRRGPDRIARGITPKDYTKITKCPARTAGRDIAGLVEMGAITRVPGTATRNARYAITLPRQSQDAGCSEPSDRAQALFQSTDTDGRLYPANPSIRYDGPIVAADGWYAIQRVASQTFVAHSVQALDDSPQVGAVVSIHHGHIIAPERQETRGMNKKRKPTP
ncbi:KfrB domain-containing protein, partial [Thiolapillus sp.]